MTTSGTLVTASIGKITVPAASIIPQGVGAPPPPGLDPRKGKLMCIKVRMLDDTVGVFHLGHKAVGQALFDEVCRHLNLLECDYFGLEFLDCFGNRCWLDKEKSILKQITLARSDARFYFVLKFYTPTPADLEEEYTRYLFALQIKRDLASGQFVCNENTAALMASYIVQSECGDFSSVDYHDHSYLSTVRFVPNQSEEFEKKVMENHKRLIGMSPAESDLALLETARRSEFYGVRFHPARDIEGTAVALAVFHLGIRVYHHLTCVNTFSWAKLRKLSFKRKKLLIKLLPESCTYYKDTIEFCFDTRNECKMFWKKAVEHHSFFRCSEVIPTSKHQSKFFTKGSSFRYCGRTQKQLIDYVREHHKRREPFTRPILSSKTKKANGERLLPTPVSSLPGTLERENGGLSTAVRLEGVFPDPSVRADHQQLPTYTATMTRQMQAELDARNLQMDDATDWQQFVENNNQQNHAPPLPVVIPPTPDTPQLKRKTPKGLTAPSMTKQQITFHFPVTEISPDSPSSSSEISRGQEDRIPQPVIMQYLPKDECQMHEWAAPPSPQLPPLSPGMDGEGAEEDNVSEDSYHLAENEERAQRMQQQAMYGEESYVSTSLPATALRTIDETRAWPAGDEQHMEALEERPKAAASMDLVFPSGSSPTQGFRQQEMQRRNANEQDPRSMNRGLSRPLLGRVMPKGPVIVARTKPIPPPKPKMGLGQLERTARGYTAEQTSFASMQPVVVNQSTITTMEVTTKTISDVHEPVVKADSPSVDEGKTKAAPQLAGPKKVAFALPGSPELDASVHPTSCLPTEHSPTPPVITGAAFPPEPAAVPTTRRFPLTVPTIEVESEETPEIKHKIVNGDIPYILHVRHVKKNAKQESDDFRSSFGSASFSTFKEPPAVKTVPDQVAAEVSASHTSVRESASFRGSTSDTTGNSRSVSVGRRKSFDLVQRKRLPSPASFSSQDHSVSPDSEHDVTGFVSKCRGSHWSKSKEANESKLRSKRADPRRMTQPVPPKAFTVTPKPARSQPCIPVAGDGGDDSGDEVISLETPSLHEGMDILEQLDDVDRVSLDAAGEIADSLRRTSLEPGPAGAAGPRFIDDRTSSESSVSAIYDNLLPMKTARENTISLSSTTGESPDNN